MIESTDLAILIIDDNPAIARDFAKILTTNTVNTDRDKLAEFERAVFGKQSIVQETLPKFQIDSAGQGQEGLEKIKQALEAGRPYALAFVDIRMPPGWDGITTIKHIWEVDPDIQIVICTAYSDYTWEQTVAALGQRENLLILKKPFDHITVRQLSYALTKKWQLLQQTRNHTAILEARVEDRTMALQESLSITRGTLESTGEGILVVNSSSTIIDYNQKLIDMWNIAPAIIESKDANILLEYVAEKFENPKAFLHLIKTFCSESEQVEINRVKTRDGRTLEYFTRPYKLNDKITGRIWSFDDISKRAELEERVHYQATHDVLTGLVNRVLLIDRVSQSISRSARDKTVFGVLFFDLDRFKLINDSFSHSTGDELLQVLAKRLKFAVREYDTLARLGGDEFVVVINSLKDKDDLIKRGKSLLNVFEQPFKLSEQEIIVTPSIGVAIYPQDGVSFDELLRNADTAMYHAKELGGNQCQFYCRELGERNVERLEMEADLRQALYTNQFFLCYQPQFDIVEKRLVSVEALIRWNHPKKGLVLPIDFIPLAEESGLMGPIGEWVLETACKQNKRWQEMGFPHIRVSVNISTQQLKQPNLTFYIKQILREIDLDAKYLELEMTENVIINSIEAVSTINELKNMGVNIALDDFGTGYSCMNYLRKIPIDRIKIDQSFIQNIDLNNGDEVIIQAIISMAKNLNLQIIAEGVETQKQLEFLKSKKCGEVQGFFFSKPLNQDEMYCFLKNPVYPNL